MEFDKNHIIMLRYVVGKLSDFVVIFIHFNLSLYIYEQRPYGKTRIEEKREQRCKKNSLHKSMYRGNFTCTSIRMKHIFSYF